MSAPGKSGQENGAPEREETLVDGRVYAKIYDSALGHHRFTRDGEPIGIREWNRTVNRHFPMRNKLFHPSALVRRLERRRISMLLDLVPTGSSPFGLDVGCESGYIASALAARGARLTAVDLDPDVLVAAKRESPPSLPVTFLGGDATALPLKGGIFDFCLCAETLEHVESVERALAELVRVTRPGGRLVLTVPNEGWILALKRALRSLGLARLLGNLSHGRAMGHIRSFRRRDLLRLLPANTRVVKVCYDKPFFLHLYVVAEVVG